MISVNDVYSFIDSFAPFSKQFEWDNAGLLIGDSSAQVTKIAFALDATSQVIEDAARQGCNLLVTHHPVIFNPLSKIGFSSPAAVAVRNGVAVISAHTNLDVAPDGVNAALAEKLGLRDVTACLDGENIIWLGKVDAVSAPDFANKIKAALGGGVSYSDCGKMIEKVAVCGGAAGEYVYPIAAAGADAFVTGEVHHHEFLDSVPLGISVFAAGHYETENPVIPVLEKKIREHFRVPTVIINQNKPTYYCGE